MIPVKLLKEAEIELWGSVDFYEEQDPGLGLDFEVEIREALHFIQLKPDLWPIRKREVRQYLLDRFPFIIHYRLEKTHIRILAIAHCSRKPGYWKERI